MNEAMYSTKGQGRQLLKTLLMQLNKHYKSYLLILFAAENKEKKKAEIKILSDVCLIYFQQILNICQSLVKDLMSIVKQLTTIVCKWLFSCFVSVGKGMG